MNDNFNSGDIVYSESGHQYQYRASIPEGVVVCPILEEYDGEEFLGDPIIVDRVFKTPPSDVLEKRIVELNSEIREKTAQLKKLKSDIDSIEKVNAERLKRFKRLEPLKNIEDFIDNKITHFVRKEYYSEGISIFSIEDREAKCHYDKHNLKLLSLLGDTKGNLEWNMNYYSDGSGSRYHVFPCLSYEEAIKKATELIKPQIEEYLSKTNEKVYACEGLIKSALSIDYKLPAEVIKRHNIAMMNKLIDEESELQMKLDTVAEKIKVAKAL